MKVLVKTLGTPTRVLDLGKRHVLNWEPSKNLLIIFGEDEIEFTQYYDKG